jgi:hypothetical protein
MLCRASFFCLVSLFAVASCSGAFAQSGLPDLGSADMEDPDLPPVRFESQICAGPEGTSAIAVGDESANYAVRPKGLHGTHEGGMKAARAVAEMAIFSAC